MSVGVCYLSVVPMRATPSDKAELVSQLLFGETFDVIEQQEKWTKIRLHHDAYEGWIDNKQYQIIDKISKKNIVDVNLLHKGRVYYSIGSFVDFDIKKKQQNSIISTAKQLLNVPYLWGGRSIFGIDCSGFVQIVYRVNGINLPRDAYQQAEVGELVDIENAKTNDLAYFANDAGKIIHVGIVIRNRNSIKIIHASGKVRIDILNKKGIYNEETKTYSHQLHSIKRIEK
jgi:cell wall-associated NlpC family hydrolase